MIEYPNFKKITGQCRNLIRSKFHIYGNSWLFAHFPKSWWKKRLLREINEIEKAKDPIECRKEICDAINILAMMYHNTVLFRYKK